MEERFKHILHLHQQAIEKKHLLLDARKAAVSVIINNFNKDCPEIVLIKRNEYDGHHSGQMAFPGGKMDLLDQSLTETAIRESYEEIGIDLSEEPLTPLLPIWVKVSNFIIHPYLTIVDKKLEFEINKREINRIFEIPLSMFRDPQSVNAHKISILGKEYWSPYFKVEGETIWGATALILYQNIYLKDPLRI
ncbi:MAG: hypothetical protein RJA76_13 [Bacteroidota bacterium]